MSRVWFSTELETVARLLDRLAAHRARRVEQEENDRLRLLREARKGVVRGDGWQEVRR